MDVGWDARLDCCLFPSDDGEWKRAQIGRQQLGRVEQQGIGHTHFKIWGNKGP